MFKKVALFIWCGMIVLLNMYSCKIVSGNERDIKAMPFPLDAVELSSSWVSKREMLNVQYLKSLDPDRLLHNFKINAGLPSTAQPLEGWESPSVGLRGHFVGHYLSSIAYLSYRNRDSLLIERLNYMIQELAKCQEKMGNGYLCAFPEVDFDVLEKQFTGVWAPYYTYHKLMQGLLDAYTYGGNKTAYQMVVGMADYAEQRMSKLDEKTIHNVLLTVGANPQNEAGGMNDVLYQLYQTTGERRYLELAKIFDRQWFLTPLAQNKDVLSGLHANTHIALVNGFARSYFITNEKLYRNAVMNFWNMLNSSHVYANGSSSGPRPNVITPTSLTSEHWGSPKQLSNTMTKEIAETCVSHNTQKVTASLFSWTANPIYAEAYMNTFYNSIMSLQNAHTGAYVYHLPLGSPRQKKFLKDNDFRCCNGSSIEAFSQLNSGIYYHDNHENIWVNLYIPSKLQWKEKGLSISQSGDFPMNQSVEFKISLMDGADLSLNLLIPSWAKRSVVYVNGKKYASGKASSYLKIRRKWLEGDSVRLVFDYDFHLKTMPDDKKVIALFYGPILLAFNSSSEIILRGSHEEILCNLRKKGDRNNLFYLYNAGKEFFLKPLYEIEKEDYGVYATISELPF